MDLSINSPTLTDLFNSKNTRFMQEYEKKSHKLLIFIRGYVKIKALERYFHK